MRRQLSLFLPSTERALVDSVRQRLDPQQHALIPAHVTLFRDDELAAWHETGTRLADLGTCSLTMQFGEPQVLPDGCVLLRPVSGEEQYHDLRQTIAGSAVKHHGPHITLLHPRNSAGVTYNLAEIGQSLRNLTVTFRTISLIEQDDSGPWFVLQTNGSGA